MRGLIVAALLLLGACALTPQQQMYAASGEYNVILGEIAAYEAKPRCVPPQVVACSDPELVEELRKRVKEANELIEKAEAIAQSSPTQAAALVSAAREILIAAQGLMLKEAANEGE